MKKSRPSVLLADDEGTVRRAIATMLTETGYEVKTASSGDEALGLLKSRHFDILVTDLRMEGMDGLDLLVEAKSAKPNLPVILVTAYGTVAQAVEAMRRGADDFVTKPISPKELKERIAKALSRRDMLREISELRKSKNTKRRRSDYIIGSSPAMRKVLDQISLVARNDVPVTIYGESGTGKELAARTIHRLSSRNEKPFVPVNCGALPEELLESELFGHVKGAFTGASSNRAGLFFAAHEGVLFLDEISEMSPRLQVGLLRVLQTGEVRPVGGDVTSKIDVRIIAATNRPLQNMVALSTFRQDLYYRINVLPMILPPLRERLEDLPELVDHFRILYNSELDKNIEGISPGALKRLKEHSWPGNVRELQNIIKQAMVVANGPVIHVRDLFQFEQGEIDATSKVDLSQPYRQQRDELIRTFEKAYATKLLTAAKGKITEAAKMGGLDRKSLWALLKRNNIDPKPFKRKMQGHSH
ncbi:MAG: sigma-54-dependent Fis family transcriptional regulator [Deltaproteobacteria bacterium]|nr:sigma-54-dependent Fis family transcriptional regulator [Deltaproteobacteria bacterium]